MKPSFRSFLSSGRAGIKFGPLRSSQEVDYKLVFKHPRSFWFLLIFGAFASIFVAVEVTVLNQAIDSWQKSDSLFSLIFALFTTFWLIGWSVGVFILVTIFIIAAFGRQALLVHSGKIDWFVGIPGLGFRLSAKASEVTETSLIDAKKNELFSKGQQFLIKTDDGNETRFGSNLTRHDLLQLQSAIKANRTLESNLGNVEYPTDTTDAKPLKMASAPTQQHEPVTLSSTSVILLLLANLIPIYGVLAYGWDIGQIMILYWAETGIIVLYNVFKAMAKSPILGFFTSLFTLAHSGGFMAVHFLFIWILFVKGVGQAGDFSKTELSEVWLYLQSLWPALLALTISHGFSFKHNFLDRYENSNQPFNQDKGLYSRIIMMHLTIIFGGFLVMLLGHAIYALLLLIVMKIWVDVASHMKLHNKGKEK